MDQSDESVLYDHFMASHIGRDKLYQKYILLELFLLALDKILRYRNGIESYRKSASLKINLYQSNRS